MSQPVKALRGECPVCRKASLRVLRGYTRCELVRCTDCGMVSTRLWPSESELQTHYANYPRNTAISPITRARYDEILDGFERFRSTNVLLDDGCGDGHFLDAARSRGWTVYGTEFSDEAIATCVAKGLTVDRPDQLVIPDRCDVVTSFEVLEHALDPAAELQRLHGLLRSGGGLYLTTPNFDAFNRRVLRDRYRVIEYPEHLNYFTTASLRLLVSDVGFSVESIRSSGLNPAELRLARRSTVAAGHQRPADTDGDDLPESATGPVDDRFRRALERPGPARVKGAVNALLSWSRLGDTLKATIVRP